MVNIVRLIDIQSRTNPRKIAIKHNGQAITYSELELSSNQIASFLKAHNFGNGDAIAVAMDRSIYTAVCLLAIMKAGAAYLPIDPTLPIERIDFFDQG